MAVVWLISACTYNWTEIPNTNVENGQQNAASTLADCQQACIDKADCNGIDYVESAAAGRKCWLGGPWSGVRNLCTAPDVKHYDLWRYCPHRRTSCSDDIFACVLTAVAVVAWWRNG